MRLFTLALLLLSGLGTFAQSVSQRFEAVGFSQVRVEDAFWKPRLEKVATVTVPVCIEQTEVKTPRIRNFEVASGMREGQFQGIFYDDSDVFKALEAIAYALNNHPSAELEKKADEWIEKIAAAQRPDGYINTYYTLTGMDKRWTDMSMHEDYNGGHLIEAAVAYFNATGKRKLLEVAIRFADHFDALFGPGKRHWVTGHQELELALVKLYNVTREPRYLKLADWLLEERGHGHAVGYTWTDWRDTAYAQDVLPVKQQTQITGHAVRAMYLYTGAADVAAITGDEGYMRAMQAVWEDVVHRNMYITGGIGSSGSNEGFSTDYDLPNERAYCETCASVGMVFWNQRMNRLTGEARYVDVLERSLYNGALDGLSATGDRFFYGNPLASNGQHFRREWFGTACCPANIARLVSSVGDYIYGKSQDGLWVNLFIGSTTTQTLGGQPAAIRMKTAYPWEGNVQIAVDPAQKTRFSLYVRIPGWAGAEAVPGGLYQFMQASQAASVSIRVNGEVVPYRSEKGYAVLDRQWKKGDVVSVDLPMDVRRVVAREEVKAAQGRVALQRGPLVYCVEGADNDGQAWNLILPDQAPVSTAYQPELLGGLTVLNFSVPTVAVAPDGLSVAMKEKTVTAIPYFAWANRGQNPMQVWIPRKISDIKVNY
jgi:DUF1680 family protein